MGIFKLNGVDYMGGGGGTGDANYEELTQAEYDALTTEEKNNGTMYFITDTTVMAPNKFQPTIYSLDEREIGVWIDGKPLYEKTLQYTGDTVITISPNDYNTKYEAIGITDIYVSDVLPTLDKLVSYRIDQGTDSNVKMYIFEYGFYPAEGKFGVSHNPGSSYIGFQINPNTTMTILYTKSSDEAGSGLWTPQGTPAQHYSTEEQIIGTWVDGSTLYEKTFITTIGNYDSSIDGYLIANDVTYVDDIIEFKGSIKHASNGAIASVNGLGLTSNWSFDIHINPSGKLLLWTGSSSYGSAIVGGKAIITIQYTKTS